MKLELEFGKFFCWTKKFVINGVKADYSDFGQKFDRWPGSGEYDGCNDMQFTGIPATKIVLTKYSITIPEYNLIVGQLAVGLSFGSCGYCI